MLLKISKNFLKNKIRNSVIFLSPLLLLAGISFFRGCHDLEDPKLQDYPLQSHKKKFRIQMTEKPKSLRPHDLRSSSGQYLYQQLACPLLKIKGSSLESSLATSCVWTSPQRILCHLSPDARWSDGSPLTAFDYEKAFQEYSKPSSQFFRSDLLLPLKKTQAISASQLLLILKKPYPEFLFFLANPLLSPFKKGLSCGPFMIHSQTDLQITLHPNPYWVRSSHSLILESLTIPESRDFPESATVSTFETNKKPLVTSKTLENIQLEFQIFSDDNLALKAFEQGNLDFLKRLPTSLIPLYEGKKPYQALDVLRMDAIFVNLNPQQHLLEKKLAPKLASCLDFKKWQSLYHAKKSPGCFGVLVGSNMESFCLESITSPQSCDPSEDSKTSVILYYSKAGGVDHHRAMEFLAHSWQSSLGVKVTIEPLENTFFQSQILQGRLGLYRRGLNLERPTCLASLEIFHSKHLQNHTGYQNTSLDRIVTTMSSLETKDPTYQKLCREGLTLLLKTGLMIPTGPIYFSFLIHPSWKGWTLNSLNHLDLSSLSFDNKN
jgi:oligopeptide transport system substrate-binding protein